MRKKTSTRGSDRPKDGWIIFWPHGDPIGQHVNLANDPKTPWLTVVGVVGVVKQYGLDIDTRMVVYYPYRRKRPTARCTLWRVPTSDPGQLGGGHGPKQGPFS